MATKNKFVVQAGSKLALMLSLLSMIWGCKQEKHPFLHNNDVNHVIENMSAIMIHDVTNPPLASRFFAYTCLAGYEILAQNDPSVQSMKGKLNDYPEIKKPAALIGYNYELSAVLCMMETAAALQPSGKLMKLREGEFIDSCKQSGYSQKELDSSLRYAQVVSKQILKYVKSDKYNRISNYIRYTPQKKAGSWNPTPPVYMAAIEPYFNTVRPLTLDSASQFLPVAPVPFSEDRNSLFFKYLLLVYKAGGEDLTPEHRAIAGFWDCNPYAVENNGHMLIGIKKISPGAHWMGITGIACQKAGTSFSKTLQIHTTVAIGLLDAFICCWDDKYRTNRIRPETAIRKYIDPTWRPLLQTPPFPEYISGHSVISTTSAVILTHFFGENFHYTDNVEFKFGLAPRTYKSFLQAAEEAALSRFWGGIHFKDAIEKGQLQGNAVGNHVLSKIENKK